MIKANELRLNNWVLAEGNPYKIKHISPDDEWGPIPLTSEILEKAGFEKHIDTDNEFYTIGDFGLHKTDGGFLHNACDESVDSLHQLQNLFFALTGTELEINLT